MAKKVFVSVPSRGLYISNPHCGADRCSQEAVSVPSRGLYISNSEFKDVMRELYVFPSPLGDYISLIQLFDHKDSAGNGFRPLSGTIYL